MRRREQALPEPLGEVGEHLQLATQQAMGVRRSHGHVFRG